MNDDVKQAQAEIASVSGGPNEAAPRSLDDVIAGLKGFGLKEFEEILTVRCANRIVKLRISNIPTEDEMASVMAAEEFRGYLWIKRVKAEILSRSITWIDGNDLRTLPPAKRLVADPTDKNGTQKDVQVVLRNIILGWGQEILDILWKVLMTHSQRIEDELTKQFPDAAVMTDVEQRLFEQAKKEMDEQEKAISAEAVSVLYDEAISAPTS